jgi:hypothetical protein
VARVERQIGIAAESHADAQLHIYKPSGRQIGAPAHSLTLLTSAPMEASLASLPCRVSLLKPARASQRAPCSAFTPISVLFTSLRVSA